MLTLGVVAEHVKRLPDGLAGGAFEKVSPKI